MFVCRDPRTETWQPNFSSAGLNDPTWTRLLCDGSVLANSLEGADWDTNPVQVLLCDGCGTDRCASGGLVHVSRLDRYVLWSAPQNDEVDAAAFFLSTRGALAIPVETWNAWPVPPADRLTAANYAAVADAWTLGQGRSPASLVSFLGERLISGNTLDKYVAIALVEGVLARFRANAALPFAQPLLSIAETGAQVETLYCDGLAALDWPAFAFAGGETYVVLNGEWMVRHRTD